MSSNSNPWAICKHLSILTLSCTLIIRVLSIGYVVGSFLVKFQDPFLGYSGINALNLCSLGVFPLGSFINALILSPIPIFIVNLFNSAIVFIGIYKRRNYFLQISSAISLLMLIWYMVLIGLWSWLIGEVYYGIKGSFVSVYSRDKMTWNNKWESLECCGADTRPLYGSDGCTVISPDGCFDLFSNKVNTYGISYIAVLVVNCFAEIIMIVGINCLNGFHAVFFKSTTAYDMGFKEIKKLRNSVFLSLCLSVKGKWKRNKLSSCFGYVSVISVAIDGAMIIAILVLRYNYYDITLTDEFYQISGGNNINMGYTKDALLITTICVLLWSVLGKATYVGGMCLNKKWLFVLYIAFEIIAVLVECVILIFAGILIRAMYCCFWKDSSACSEYTYFTTTASPTLDVCESFGNTALFLWTSTGILIFHIVLKVLSIVASDRVYKMSFSKTSKSPSDLEVSNDDPVGFFNDALLKTKRHPVVATVVVISIIICIADSLYLCGLCVVRYGYSSYPFIDVSDVLNTIMLGPLRMSSNRDNAIIIGLSSLSFSFFLQLGKFVSIAWRSPKWILLILWLELPVIILQLVSLSFVAILLKLVYCCSDASNCDFSYEKSLTLFNPIHYTYSNSTDKLLCENEQRVRDRIMLQSWLMIGFGALCTVLQVVSIITGYRYFKRSDDGHLGIFKGVLELFKNMYHKISHNRFINEKTMPNYNKAYGLYCILSATSLVMELVFGVCLYAYYFTAGDSSSLLEGLNRFTYYYYSMDSLYRGVSIAILVIIPLASTLRIAAFVWFGFRKSKIPFYTILVIISIWTIGEVVVLGYTSYILRLAYGCIDSDVFGFSEPYAWLRPSRSTVCAGFDLKLFVQSGLTVAYLVTHIILDICILGTMDVMHPYIGIYGDGRRFSAYVYRRAITELKKQTPTQRLYFALLTISLVLNLIFWIGLILMGLIPGYIHNGFLSIISRIDISFGSIDMENAVLGVMYSLIAVVPLLEANHITGLISSFKQNGIMLWVFILSLLVLCITDLVYLVFSSDIVNFRSCFCEKRTNCIKYNLTTTESEYQQVCGDLFLNSSSVLLAYIVLTMIAHIIGLFLGIKILRGFRKTRVGIDGEENILQRDPNLDPSLRQEDSNIQHENIGENLTNSSHTANNEGASMSEITMPSNGGIEENFSIQNSTEIDSGVTAFGNRIETNDKTEEKISSQGIPENDKMESENRETAKPTISTEENFSDPSIKGSGKIVPTPENNVQT